MKKKRPSRSGLFDPRILLGFVLAAVGVLLALVGLGMFSWTTALAQDPKQKRAVPRQTVGDGKIAAGGAGRHGGR